MVILIRYAFLYIVFYTFRFYQSNFLNQTPLFVTNSYISDENAVIVEHNIEKHQLQRKLYTVFNAYSRVHGRLNYWFLVVLTIPKTLKK